MRATYKNQTAPRQTVMAGTRIVTVKDIAFIGGWNSNSRRPGAAGVVLRYETPTIQERQVWPDESYVVQFDDEQRTRLLSRSDFVTVPDTVCE